MKATGIVRRIDDLGRVVVLKKYINSVENRFIAALIQKNLDNVFLKLYYV